MKTVKFWLITSLCVNLMLIGLFAGGAFRARQKHMSDGPRDEIGAVLFYAPENIRKKMHDDVRKSVEDRRAKGRGFRLPEFVEILQAPELDQKKLEAYFAANREFNNQSAKDAHERMIEAVASMTLEERLEIAQKIQKQVQKQDHD